MKDNKVLIENARQGKVPDAAITQKLSVSTIPLLRWVGGKQQLLQKLLSSLPEDVMTRRYVEPFVGAGSLFFALSPKKAYLSDANARLIQTYKSVRIESLTVRIELARLITEHSVSAYYQVRERYNACTCSSPEQAARFIYLNKTCFNGIFRVNKKGHFNVPKGSKDHMPVPTQESLDAAARSLANAVIECRDFSEALQQVRATDFVYLDPPYPALNSTAYFSHYTVDRFPPESQEKLARAVRRIHHLGAKVLVSNADLPAIRDLYKGFTIESVPVTRYVNSTGTRTAVCEVLIRNY